MTKIRSRGGVERRISRDDVRNAPSDGVRRSAAEEERVFAGQQRRRKFATIIKWPRDPVGDERQRDVARAARAQDQ